MATYTDNMKLKKPDTTHQALIADVNANMGTLDTHRHSGVVVEGKNDGLPVKAVQSGPLASRPLAGTAGQLYVATDVPALYLDNGSVWTQVEQAVARKNLLVNGGFEIWQRGNGPFTTNGAYGPDRWGLSIDGTDTMSVSKDTTNRKPNSAAAASVLFTRGSGTNTRISQVGLEIGPHLRGSTVSFSVCVKLASGVANAVRLFINTDGSGGGATYSGYHGNNTDWETLTVTAVVPSDATTVNAAVQFMANCTAYLDNAMLVEGLAPANYSPLHPTEEWDRCLRYYEVHGQDGTIHMFYPRIDDSASGAHLISRVHAFVTRKAVPPTVTKVGAAWTVGNCDQPTVAQPKMGSYFFRVTAAAAGAVGCYPSSNTDVVIAEANP